MSQKARMAAIGAAVTVFAALMIVAGGSMAAVPSAERAGLAAAMPTALPGIQLANACGNWLPSQRNESEDCLVKSWRADPDWIRRGDLGSQDDSVPSQPRSGANVSVPQDDDNPPCFC